MNCRRSYLSSRAGIRVVLLLLLCLTACASQDTSIPSQEEAGEAEAKAPSPLGVALLYIPNRIFDAAELVRLGVNVGIGLGVDARATWGAQAALIQDTSVGIGYQGLRHFPFCMRIGHSVRGIGPIKSPDPELYDWPVNDYDVRLELFALLLGAHVAVDFEAIYDFFAGILTLDPSEDDFKI